MAKQLRDVPVSFLESPVEGRESGLVPGLDRRPGLEQQSDHPDLPEPGGGMERGASIAGPGIDIMAFQQTPPDLSPVPVLRGEVQPGHHLRMNGGCVEGHTPRKPTPPRQGPHDQKKNGSHSHPVFPGNAV